jgi:prevent-host-death family protein
MTQVSISEAGRNLSHWINKASYGRDLVFVTSRGKAKVGIIGADTFAALVGMQEYAQRELQPIETFCLEFRTAVAEAGFQTREEIVDLVRGVKQEMATESHQE